MGEEVKFTKNVFLRCMCVVFLFAFTSFYLQIPGLYGKDGILPARTQLITKGAKDDWAALMQKKPTLLWFGKSLGIETEHLMEILSLIGIFFSLSGFISQKCCTKPTFSALWSLYYSLYQVGQTFMWFQWDILLLESGFLCLLIAPWIHRNTRGKKQPASEPCDFVNMWLVRWLLFRLMFASGVVKLTSGCPTWWGLKALNVHFESQCLPTPLAWYAHHLPTWFLKFNTVFANFAEILVPPLFFLPVRAVRIVAFYIQIFLQIGIILTGNYNFFNFLTITLCLSLVDDSFFLRTSKKSSFLSKLLKAAMTGLIYGVVIYATIVLYGVKLMPGGVIESKITFTPADFDLALSRAVPGLIVLGFLSLLSTAYHSFKLTYSQPSSSLFWRLFSFGKTSFYLATAIFLFADSLVPFSTLHPAGNDTVTPYMKEVHENLSHLHLTNAYGLFRKMTGVGGRPEVIIEGSNDMNGPWLEYNFKYKPGNVNDSLPFVAPYQPRLDWQMWFAALGTYHQNPWLMSFTYRLLTGQTEVLNLIDNIRNPFPGKAPKYIRANLYHYHYTPYTQRNSPAVWTRQKVSEYFPVFAKDHPPLLEYLKNFNILGDQGKETPSPSYISDSLLEIRKVFYRIEPPFLVLSLVLTGLAIIIFGSLSSSGGGASSSSGSGGKQQPQAQQHQQSKGKKNKK